MFNKTELTREIEHLKIQERYLIEITTELSKKVDAILDYLDLEFYTPDCISVIRKKPTTQPINPKE